LPNIVVILLSFIVKVYLMLIRLRGVSAFLSFLFINVKYMVDVWSIIDKSLTGRRQGDAPAREDSAARLSLLVILLEDP
jgi:hypothetical protein